MDMMILMTLILFSQKKAKIIMLVRNYENLGVSVVPIISPGLVMPTPETKRKSPISTQAGPNHVIQSTTTAHQSTT